MDQLTIISDSVDVAADIGRQLVGVFETQFILRQSSAPAKPGQYTIVHIGLNDKSYLSSLRLWLSSRPKGGKAIFIVDRGVRHQAVQAYSIGATDLLERPFTRKMLLAKLLGDIGSLAGDLAADSIGDSKGAADAVGALQSIFDATVSGGPIELKKICAAGETIVADIETDGLARWIDIVRKHHSQTYQHCLLVTGIAVAFGRHLGFSARDRQRLALAGLMHDLGKAEIPIEILEKPGPLDASEIAVMRRHPELGYEALRDMNGVEPDVLDMVLHHHEFLDGSGYPHGLQANKLPDLARMMTIADIYGALLERRSYKACLSPMAAYQILEDMGPKLDRDLVREFRSVGQMQDS